MRTTLVVCLMVVAAAGMSSTAVAGVPGDSLALTGDLRTDFFGLRELGVHPPRMGQPTVQEEIAGHKSPYLAAGLSVLVPGAGEFYAESYWRSALFFAIEVAAWGIAYSYDKQGDRATDTFQDFADAHWSMVRYAQYAQDKFAPAGGPYNWLKPGTEGQAPWDRVDIGELNRMERAIAGYFSHNLAPHGDQQYYEMIGKYTQFNMGWDDANQALPPIYEVQDANLSSRMVFYGGERKNANTYYERATTFVTVAILNHVISAIDAALAASQYNRSVQAKLGFQTVPDGTRMTRVPVLKVQVAL